jgi:TRAP-type C4-dicarboxylate transport system substrate-binding protein
MTRTSHRIRIGLTAATLAFAAAATTPASAAETIKFLWPWSKVNKANWDIVQSVIKDIEAISKGNIKVKDFNRTVVPPFKQLQPVSAGAFDLHYTSTGYHAGATSMGQLGDTLKKDPKLRRGSGLFDLLDKHYQKSQKLKLLGWAGTPGYHILLKKPLEGEGDLKGLKIRGNPAYKPLIDALGGTMITLPAPQIYTSLQKNLIDGASWVQHSMVQRKFYEVVKYMARPVFGTSTQVLLMNLARYNKLSPEMQKVMQEAGKNFEVNADKIVSADAEVNLKGMLDKGVKITKYGPKYYDRIQQIYNEGVWKRIAGKHGAEAEAMIKIIKEKGVALK